MNRNSYRRFYDYGAYASGEFEQEHELHQHRYTNFQRFLDANPGIVPVKKRKYLLPALHTFVRTLQMRNPGVPGKQYPY